MNCLHSYCSEDALGTILRQNVSFYHHYHWIGCFQNRLTETIRYWIEGWPHMTMTRGPSKTTPEFNGLNTVNLDSLEAWHVIFFSNEPLQSLPHPAPVNLYSKSANGEIHPVHFNHWNSAIKIVAHPTQTRT